MFIPRGFTAVGPMAEDLTKGDMMIVVVPLGQLKDQRGGWWLDTFEGTRTRTAAWLLPIHHSVVTHVLSAIHVPYKATYLIDLLPRIALGPA